MKTDYLLAQGAKAANASSYWGGAEASILTQVILIVTRGGLPVQKVRFGLVEDRGEVERERYAPLFSQAYCAGVR